MRSNRLMMTGAAKPSKAAGFGVETAAKVPQELERKIRRLRDMGWSVAGIARQCGCEHATVAMITGATAQPEPDVARRVPPDRNAQERALTAEEIAARERAVIRSLIGQGISARAISKRLGISMTNVMRIAQEDGVVAT